MSDAHAASEWRRRLPASAFVAALLVALLAISAGEASLPRPLAQPRNPVSFTRVQIVARGLQAPWALAFPDRRTILVTERPGRVRIVVDGRLRREPVARVSVVAEGEGGLLGLALHPDFARQRLAYLYYTARDGNRVSRFRVTRDFRFSGERVLLRGIPAAANHDGGRIAFGPDGMLYVATGDAGRPELAADRRSLAGKILRIRPDGRIPGDNPFRGSPVFSYGHRNPQGLAWDGAGRLYESEHGPSGELGLCCNDELNVIAPGRFYGWPFWAGRTRAAPGSPPAPPVAPIAASDGSTWAPAGLAVYRAGDGRTVLFVATLRGERLLRFVLAAGSARRVAGVATALNGFGRLRAANVGPDRCLYLTTSNRDGRGTPRAGDDRILRLCPRP